MSDDQAQPLPGGPQVALGALAAAIERLHEANSRVLSEDGSGPIVGALGDGLSWIAKLDNWHASVEGKDAYYARRAADVQGRTVGGLVFARNFDGHGLLIAGEAQLTVHEPTLVREGDKITLRWARLPGRGYGAPDRGTVFSVELRWTHLANLPKPTGKQYGRDEWYRDLVAGKPLSNPLDTAHEWFASRAP